VVEEQVINRLKEISGIASFSRVFKTENDIEKIQQRSLEFMQLQSGRTFKVRTRRADKSFPFHSDEVNRKVAGRILANTAFRVDVNEPDILLEIEIRIEGVFIYGEKIKGAGGYPLGIAGKGLVMLSGGIDSPVAAYLAMNRGIKIEAIHYASPPYTSEQAKQKVIDLLKVLSKHRLPIKLHIVPFTTIQETIYEKVDESYAITIMRRMMYRIAERVAKRRNCLALISGESVGQVASQTLHSLKMINEVTNLPVIRPLATTDKLDIINISQKIGTYDISIRPFIDCCTIFTPKNPVTRPNEEHVLKYEESFDYETLIWDAIHNIKTLTIDENFEVVEGVDEFF
jgi:thiamine biosynthesis protein ThiI